MKICFVTGSRADYGLLEPLIKKFQNLNNFKTNIIVTGSHLSKKHGLTINEIIKNRFSSIHKVNLKIKEDYPDDICNYIALAVKLISKKLLKIKPDLLVVLGDRYEIFSASTSALVHQIPICHLHGGELTRGAYDNAFRHSISKMANLHLVASKVYKQRLIQMGEMPNNVHIVGGFGVDLIKRYKLLKKKDLEKKLKIKFKKKNILVTFHPVTLEKNTSKLQFSNILKSLKKLKDTQIIFTETSLDSFGNVINTMIKNFVSKNKKISCRFKSMGQLNYLSTLQFVDAVVGNSSSGLLEAPSFKIGTINIGDRQTDRLKASSVIDCKPISKKIDLAIKKIYSKKFIKKLKKVKNPYGSGGAVNKTFSKIKNKNFRYLIKKNFYDFKK
jgi:GDP/UDP-N,N'-diacetylbacillosamine 2-epimerase (hydrolysing)